TAFAKQGKKSLANGDYVNAQRNFQTAKNMLKQISKKSSRLVKLDQEIDRQANSTDEQAAVKETDIASKTKPPSKNNSSDDIFGPKKKW
ncbi:MAG: hypothetical protein L3J46_08365, partial [Kangiellaceae bacterium]|nr:hypothetical protein [Kangiellaceae bacterium]